MPKIATAVALASLMLAPTSLAADLSKADKAAIFKAAGFELQGGSYTRCADDPSASKQPGSIELQDLDADGVDEVFVTESSVFCYGNTAQAFVLLTKDAKTGWRKLLDEVSRELSLLRIKSSDELVMRSVAEENCDACFWPAASTA